MSATHRATAALSFATIRHYALLRWCPLGDNTSCQFWKWDQSSLGIHLSNSYLTSTFWSGVGRRLFIRGSYLPGFSSGMALVKMLQNPSLILFINKKFFLSSVSSSARYFLFDGNVHYNPSLWTIPLSWILQHLLPAKWRSRNLSLLSSSLGQLRICALMSLVCSLSLVSSQWIL